MSVGSDPQHEALKSRLQQDPDSLLFARLADSMLAHGQVDEAIRICEEGIRKHPYYVTGHMVLGKCYLKKKLFDLAEKEFKRVILFDPKYIAAHKYYGDLMREVGWDNTCEMSYRKILSIDPLDRNAREMLEALQRNKPNDQEVVTPGHADIIEDKISSRKSAEERESEDARTKTVPINLDEDLFADVSGEEKEEQAEPAEASAGADSEEKDEQVITTILEDIFDDEEEAQPQEAEPAVEDDAEDEIAGMPIRQRVTSSAEPESEEVQESEEMDEHREAEALDAQDDEPEFESDFGSDEDDFEDEVLGLNIERRKTPQAAVEPEPEQAEEHEPEKAESESQPEDPFAGMFDQFDEETIEFEELNDLESEEGTGSKASSTFDIDFSAEDDATSSESDEDEENYFDTLESDDAEDDIYEQMASDGDAEQHYEPEPEKPIASRGYGHYATPGREPSYESEPEPASQNGEQPHFEESTGFERDKIVTPTLGEIYAAQGQYAKAINVFELLLKKEPANSSYQQKVAFLRKKMEESENA